MAASGPGSLGRGRRDELADFCAHELLSLHEIVSGTVLDTKILKAHLGDIEDGELKTIADNALKAKKEFIDQVASILE